MDENLDIDMSTQGPKKKSSKKASTPKEDVCVIGGGIAGLLTTYLIEKNRDYRVTLIEKEEKLGGHDDTVDIPVVANGETRTLHIEAGAEFFTTKFYPNFMKLLRYLRMPLEEHTLTSTFYHVDTQKGIKMPPIHDGKVVWSSLLNPSKLWKLLQLKWTTLWARPKVIQKDTTSDIRGFLDSIYVTRDFKERFLMPFLAGGWGEKTKEFETTSTPVAMNYIYQGSEAGPNSLKNFFGAGNIWQEVETGLGTVIEALASRLKKAEVELNTAVESIEKEGEKYRVTTSDGNSKLYDKVVLAVNSKVAAKLIKGLPGKDELWRALDNVGYYDTHIAIHTDPRFMPEDKSQWSVANVRTDGTNAMTTIYKEWKMRAAGCEDTPVFKSWITQDIRNPSSETDDPMPRGMIAERVYQHPYIDWRYHDAQRVLDRYQGQDGVYFSGFWTVPFKNDSQEDAVNSSIRTAQELNPEGRRLQRIFSDEADATLPACQIKRVKVS